MSKSVAAVFIISIHFFSTIFKEIAEKKHSMTGLDISVIEVLEMPESVGKYSMLSADASCDLPIAASATALEMTSDKIRMKPKKTSSFFINLTNKVTEQVRSEVFRFLHQLNLF